MEDRPRQTHGWRWRDEYIVKIIDRQNCLPDEDDDDDDDDDDENLNKLI